MGYRGNPSLSSEIQNRIVGTFRQTARLAAEGKTEEAQLGCDFMLRLDPLFEPAETLQRRLLESDGDVEIDDLLELVGHEEVDAAPPNALEVDADRAAADPGRETAADQGAADSAGSMPALSQVGGAASTGPAALGGGPDEKIQQLLREGDKAFEEFRFQQAIDSWSRIFLIDVDHPEAHARIEEAQRRKAEIERQVEQLSHEGVAAFEDGSFEKAQRLFQEILTLSPDHASAQGYLQRIANGEVDEVEPATGSAEDSGEGPVPAAAPGPAPPPVVPAAPRPATGRGPSWLQNLRLPDLPLPAALTRRGTGRFLIIGAVALLLVVALAWVLWSRRSNLFPNSSEESAAASTPAASLSRVDRAIAARQVGDEGAASILEAIPEGHPEHERAQRLLAEWRRESASAEDGEAVAAPEGPPRDELLEAGREAYGERRYLLAARSFLRASRIEPLGRAELELFEDAKRQLEPIATQIDLFNQGQFELALQTLWRRYEEDPSNRDVYSLLVSSYYNLAVRELQRNRPHEAQRHLQEAIDLDSDDLFMRRLERFAEAYTRLPRDLLYDVFVGQLELRR